jgi:CRP-like cAMP-binding protein
VALPVGSAIFKPGDGAAILAVLTGQVEVTGAGGVSDSAKGGDVVGMYEALSGRFMTATATVVATGNALRIDRADLFELMADNIPLLQGIFSGLLHTGAPGAEAPHPAHAPALP